MSDLKRKSHMEDRHVRSVTKSISWRIIGTIITSALVFLFTGQWAISITVGGAEFVVKSLAFYIHERAWLRIGWGKRDLEPVLLEDNE